MVKISGLEIDTTKASHCDSYSHSRSGVKLTVIYRGCLSQVEIESGLERIESGRY